MFDEHGNYDEAATRNLGLSRHLRQNTKGMGFGAPHCHQGNNNRVPDDPYANIKFTMPSFSGHYDAEEYLDWEMKLDKPLVSLKILLSFGGLVSLPMVEHL